MNLKSDWMTEESIKDRENHEAVAYLGLNCLKDEKETTRYPITKEDIEKCGLKANAVFDCEIAIIKGGTCTPISFTFFD